MKFKPSNTQITEMDMTPMIDMTFQLVAFLMIMCNFSGSESDARVVLPSSVLARPVDTAPDNFFQVQMTDDGNCIVEGRIIPQSGLYDMLLRKAQYFESRGKQIGDVTVIVRAHKDAPMGKVQELIKECQRARFEKFVLRAKEEMKY
jgi:biopolymer transport protein ExbD